MDTLQTHVYQDGHWTTTTVPRSEILARMNAAEARPVEEKMEPPEYGLLTHTIVESPVIRKCLVVGCRRGNAGGDVVLVGEQFVELCTMDTDGRLRRGLARHRFDAVILDATTFKHRPRPRKPSKTAAASTASAATQSLVDEMFDELIIKDEPTDSTQMGAKQLPPELLVLSLDTGDLVFAYVRQGKKGLKWVLSTKKIGAAGVREAEDKPGRKMCIDPWSRYMHVCTFGSRWYLLRLCSTEDLEEQMARGGSLDPITEVRIDKHGLAVVNACFLFPKYDELDHTLLLLTVIDPQKNYRVILHEWNYFAKDSLKDIDFRKEGIRLFDSVTMALFVVPLSTGSSFLMVTEYEIAVGCADELRNGNTKFEPLLYRSERILPPPEGHPNLVTAIAISSKPTSFTHRIDYLYYTMEDGSVHLLQIDGSNPRQPRATQNNIVATIPTLIPSPALCIIREPASGRNILLIPGDCSNGGTLVVDPVGTSAEDYVHDWNSLLPNWSPIFDATLITPPPSSLHGRLPNSSLYVTSGFGPAGAISEIRTGYSAHVQTSADYIPLIRNIWALPDATGNGYFLLSSKIDSGHLVHLDNEGQPEAVDEPEEGGPLCLGEATLAAGQSGSVSVQVTANAIRIVELKAVKSEEEAKDVFVKQCGAGETIVRADVGCGHVAVVMSTGEEMRLIVAEVPNDMSLLKDESAFKPIGEHVLLGDESSGVSLVAIRGVPHVVVGTWSATLQVYRLEKGAGLLPVTEVALQPETNGDIAMEPGTYICEDFRVLESYGQIKLVGGLRGGSLVVFDVKYEDDMLSFTGRKEFKIATVPVMFLKGAHCSRSALAIAGPDIYQVDLVGSTHFINKVIFEGSEQPKINAATRLSHPNSEYNIIACVTEEELFYANISAVVGPCVRHIPLHAPPKRLLYYSTLETLIVACSGTTGLRPEPPNLKFFNPITGQSLLSGPLIDMQSHAPFFNKRNEQINALCEWRVSHSGLEFHYVVVGTSYSPSSSDGTNASLKGRMVFFSVIKTPPGSKDLIDVRRRYQCRLEGPVYAICPVGNRLVYGAGRSLFIGELDTEQKRFKQIDEYVDLRCPAIYITAQPYTSSESSDPPSHKSTESAPKTPPETFDTIHISTTATSLHILRFSHLTLTLTPQSNTPLSHHNFCHLPLSPSLHLTTSKSASLTLHWVPHHPNSPPSPTHHSLHPLIDAALPVTLSRLLSLPAPPIQTLTPATAHEGTRLLATAVDGSILGISILSKPVYNLLHLLSETLADLSREAREARDIHTGISSPTHTHHPRQHKSHASGLKKGAEKRVLSGERLARCWREGGRERVERAVGRMKEAGGGRGVLVELFGEVEGEWGGRVWGVLEGVVGGGL